MKINKNGRYGVAVGAVRKVIGAMYDGQLFNGWELKKECVKLYPDLKNMYVETFLREMREYCKSKYILVSRSESLYKKVGEPVEV